MNINSLVVRLWVTGGGGGWRGVFWEGVYGFFWVFDVVFLGCGWRVFLWVVVI